MRVDVPSSGRFFVPGAGPAQETILRAVRTRLTGVDDPLLAQVAGRVDDWAALIAIANRNRLSSLIHPALKSAGVAIPAGAAADFDRFRSDSFRINSRNLMTLRRVVPALEEAGIKVLVFKGPVQQQQIYGDPFLKPSGDVDLLVPPGQFRTARAALQAIGYELPKECASPWWEIFLGEQHLSSRAPDLTIVDLHHRVQQPGCPSPRSVRRFIEERSWIEVGSVKVPTLSPTNTALLMCMSLVKALSHHEPAAGYAADIVAALGAAGPAELADFERAARRQGLHNTARLALRIVELLLGVTYDLADPGEFRILDRTTDDDLLNMSLTPADPVARWPKRRVILWELGDRGMTGYGQEVGWALAAEACRRLFQHPAPARP